MGESYHSVFEFASRKSGASQSFGNLILSRHPIGAEVSLASELEWVAEERKFFQGNIVARAIESDFGRIHVINVHSPAWPCDRQRLSKISSEGVKLVHNPDVWCTEILWKLLFDSRHALEDSLIVAGDFNSSETFDSWPGGPRGNREIIDRMNALGLTDALRSWKGDLVPTFRNSKGGKIVHQLDHMYLSADLLRRLISCETGSAGEVFGRLSDHLPIIADIDPSPPV